MKDILIICCGFIGFNLSRFLSKNYKIYNLDNFIDNYSIDFKKNRLKNYIKIKFIFEDVKNILKLKSEIQDPSTIFHLLYKLGKFTIISFKISSKQYWKLEFIDNSNITMSLHLQVFLFMVSQKTQEDRISLPSFYASTKQYNESMFKYFLTIGKLFVWIFLYLEKL